MITQTKVNETETETPEARDEYALRREIREFQVIGQPLTQSEKDLLARKCGGV
jgi:hypothetical protein